jgi:hypothetical protein
MKEIYYAYNNEALASCIFLSILNKKESIEISRLFLVLPFILDDRTVNYLSDKILLDKIEYLEELIDKKPRYFVSFNKRYLSFLPVSINALKILYNTKQIVISGKYIEKNTSFDADNFSLGNRFRKINRTIPLLLSMIEEYKTDQLYKILRIQL